MPTPTVISHVAEVFTALPRRIVDGDTWWCYVDQDYRTIGLHEYRLLGWDTPEKQSTSSYKVTSEERAAAYEAMRESEEWWATQVRAGNRRIFVETQKDPEKYGRWLAVLWAETAAGEQFHLGPWLAAAGLAVPSDGTKGTRWRNTFIDGPPDLG